MKKYITHKKSRIIGGTAVTAALLGAWGFSVSSAGFEMPYGIINLLLIFIVSAVIFLDISFKKAAGALISILIPPLCFYLFEGYSHFGWEIAWQIQILNILFYYLVFAAAAAVLGSVSRASVFLAFASMIIGLINYYTVCFRSSPILPWDIRSIGTALSVTGNFQFTLPGKILMVSLFFVIAAALGAKSALKLKKGLLKRLILSALSIVLVIGFGLGLQTKYVQETFELDDVLFYPNTLYKNNGFMVSFVVNLQYMRIDNPKGYSVDAVEKIAKSTKGSAQVSAELTQATLKDCPNIVVVMNEAFSDLSVIADFETNADFMPFMHSLSEKGSNAVTGNLYVSVLGGNTANTEFEFLTGNTMAFLPQGSIAYQQYVKSYTPSLAWNLKNIGYSTMALHPFYASGWNRDEVYPLLGFQKTLFKEQMSGAALMRQYISDEASYQYIMDAYENKADGVPMFTFEVTMQNHGGYFEDYPNFEREIELPEVKDGVDKEITERYLSLIKKSDEAFEILVSYFKSYDEPTVVVMFGDHQPGDYAVRGVYDTYAQYSFEALQNRYIVPFAIWANFDIEEEYIDKISANYLSALILEKAKLPLTGYQTFLSELRRTLPVVTANVIIDRNGNEYMSGGGDTPYEAVLNEYKILQYNQLFDEKGRLTGFFAGDAKE